MVIRCDSCSMRYRIPPTTVGERGAQVKCPECAATIVVFPTDDVSMVIGAEPPTMDWTPLEVLPVTEPDSVPRSIRALFAGEQVHPPGTVPPVQRRAVPTFPQQDAALSVTPPPPRAVRSHRFNPAGLHSIAPPALLDDVPLHTSPPPRHAPSSTPPEAPPSLEGRFTHGGAPPRSLHSAKTQEPAAQRESYGGGYPTAPHGGNRTGPTGGGTPPRATYGSRTEPDGMSYAPPWGAPAWNTAPPAPSSGHPASFGGPGTPLPQWQAHQQAAWYNPYGPPTGPHPGASGHTHPGTPAMAYTAPWNTAQPAPSNQGPPVMTTWQPQWMPAIVLGMERTTLGLLLLAVLTVGFVGSCLGVGSGRFVSGVTDTVRSPRARIPGTSAVGAPLPTPVVPLLEQDAPLPVPLERPSKVAPSPVLKLPPLPVTLTPDRLPQPGPPLTLPFDVNATDVRDPWADAP